jgi:hypothetical protein
MSEGSIFLSEHVSLIVMIVTIEEKIYSGFWWIISIAITAYLCWGIANTISVLT